MSQPTVKTVSTTVDVVIPVLNEAHVLEKSVDTVRRFLARGFDYSWKLVLIDNGSTDGTDQVAQRSPRSMLTSNSSNSSKRAADEPCGTPG